MREEKTGGIRFVERTPTRINSDGINKVQLLLPNGIRIGIEGEANLTWLCGLLKVASGASC